MRPWMSVDRQLGALQSLPEAVRRRNRRALLLVYILTRQLLLPAALISRFSLLRTPAYNMRPWMSVDRQLGGFQSLPEAVRRRN
jgi:hypothetical protein